MKHTHTETDLAIENQYPKLVRDRIPEIVERNGQSAPTHIAEKEEYIQHLLAKLVEEATELKHAVGVDHQKEEMADVREVLETLREALEFAEHEIQAVQTSKAAERGGFRGRIIMDAKAS